MSLFEQNFSFVHHLLFWCVKREGFLCETDSEEDHRRPGTVTQVTAGLFV